MWGADVGLRTREELGEPVGQSDGASAGSRGREKN